jgi:hypothetical protein
MSGAVAAREDAEMATIKALRDYAWPASNCIAGEIYVRELKAGAGWVAESWDGREAHDVGGDVFATQAEAEDAARQAIEQR